MGKDKLLVILDLDHSLIYCPDNHEPKVHGVSPDKIIVDGEDTYPLYCRPFVYEFTRNLFSDDDFEVGVWTAASEGFAKEYLSALNIEEESLKIFLTSKDCVHHLPASPWSSGGIAERRKDLNKVVKKTGHSIERMIAVDDSTDAYWRQYGNLVKLPKFEGDMTDNILDKLYPYLKFLHKQENVRTIEKRGWFNSAEHRADKIYNPFSF